MAHQSLYRRYRSQTFGEILGQEHVTTGLRNAIAEDRQSHAYLFSGPRGTGKTSTARVLAKALNCENLSDGEPCGTCASCVAIESGKSFDLHELDAASHNKVDDVRDLISKVQLGSPGRTKVYILDEVHMLSSGAENALLKTLEEPPDHVVFVLATTEPQKVVSTIKSRTQHYEFHLLPADVLDAHVRWLIEDAGLDVSEDAIEYVLRVGGGSARDTLSALDLVAAAGGIPEGTEVAEQLVEAIGDRDPARAIATVQQGLEIGREPRVMGEEVLELLRNSFLAAMGAPLTHLNDLAAATAERLAKAVGPAALTRSLEAIGQALVEMRQAPDPRIPFEVTLLGLTRADAPATAPSEAGAGSTPGAASGESAADTGPLVAKIEALEGRIAELEAHLRSLGTPPGGRPSAPNEGEAPTVSDAATPADRPSAGASGAPRAPRPPRRPGATRRAAPQRTAADGGAGTAASPNDTPSGADDRGSGSGQAPGTDHQESGTGPAPVTDHRGPGSGQALGTDHRGSGSGPAPVTDDPGSNAGSASGTAAAGSDTEPTPEVSPPGGSGPGAATGPAATGPGLGVDEVVDALAQRLDDLSQKVRARYKGGRVVAVDGSVVHFGAPNSIHRDRCAEVKGDVEEALTAHFGHPVAVEVVIDNDGAAPPDPARPQSSSASGGSTTSANDAEDEDDIGPIAELADATDQSSTGVDRLTEAFPGSTVIDSGAD